MACCKKFDKFLSIEHTNRAEYSIRFEKMIEPGILSIMDLNIMQSVNKEATDDVMPMELRLLSLKDEEFIFDKCVFDETNLNEPCPTQINVEYSKFVYSPLRAATIQWPYYAISGIGNFILVVNAYDP